jgi:hypothetical protein
VQGTIADFLGAPDCPLDPRVALMLLQLVIDAGKYVSIGGISHLKESLHLSSCGDFLRWDLSAVFSHGLFQRARFR